jgi:hypothetical protein
LWNGDRRRKGSEFVRFLKWVDLACNSMRLTNRPNPWDCPSAAERCMPRTRFSRAPELTTRTFWYKNSSDSVRHNLHTRTRARQVFSRSASS